MNLDYFIAKRIYSDKESKKQLSKPIIKIAQISIALGIVVMLISISVTVGFKNQMKNKTVGFGSHIQIVNYDLNNSYESIPITKNYDLINRIKNIEGVKFIQEYATKAAVFKNNKQVEGIILKGVNSTFNSDFFTKNILKGSVFDINDSVKSNQILISEKTAKSLQIDLGDTILTYFIQKPIRFRKFIVSGIFNTGIPELDKMYAIIDIKHIQKLNKWEKNMISGLEINISNFDDIDKTKQLVQNEVGYGVYKDKQKLRVESIKDVFPMLFEWIGLFDANVWVILILITAVAGFNMVSGLLVIILENTQMIGVLKTMGSKNRNIRNLFLYYSAMLIIKGIIWGNIIGIGLLSIQYYFGLIKLDPESYYVDTVPVEFSIGYFSLLNIATIIVTVAMLIIPSMIVSRITPSKAIRFN